MMPPPSKSVKPALTAGFTLIELSVVLVIIGLIVGGIVTGQSLIAAAALQAQITQIQKLTSAANTFMAKYGYLPGDIPNPPAVGLGLPARGQYQGEGDGNGVIEGTTTLAAGGSSGYAEGTGETAVFWVDLSTASLIDGMFNTATSNTYQGAVSAISAWFPTAKIGQGNYIYVWSGGINAASASNGLNYFGLSAVQQIDYGGSARYIWSTAGLTVSQAYAIDSKIDDGFPQTGRVSAMYLGFSQGVSWAAGQGGARQANFGTSDTSATTGSAITCYDNDNTAGATQQYSMEQSNGGGVNCALSFQFQ